MLQKKERQIKTVVFNRLYFLTSDLLFDFLQRIQPVLLRRPEHKMLNYIFTIYLAQWILDREDFTIAWFLFLYLINMGVLSDCSSYWMSYLWPHSRNNLYQVLIFQLLLVTCQKHPICPYKSTNQENNHLTWNPFNLPHAYHIPCSWLCKMQDNRNKLNNQNIIENKQIEDNFNIIIPKLDVCPWTEVQSSPSQPSQDSWTQDPEVLVLWLFSKQKQ